MTDDERLAKVAEVLRKRSSWWPTPLGREECADLAQSFAPLLDEFRAEDEARALREAAAAAGWMQYPASQDPRDWAKWLRTRADDAALAAAEPDAGER